MAKIKGITIEIGGNTQPLNKALADVNKKSKDLQSELRQVERLLKMDPGNTELLAQKQKLLAEAVQNSKEKLDRLKAAQQQVNEQFAKGDISEEQYRAFQREVAKAEQELKGFERQLNETAKATDTWKNKLDKAQTSLKNVGAKMTDVGKNLSMKVTAPVLGLGAAVAKTGMEFDAAMSEVGAISGATGEDLQKLEALAKEMGATTKFSASEAAEGLKYMAMAGWETQQQIDALPGILMLAAASGEELGAVSDIVTDAMTAFGMEAARAGEFADVLAAASSNANTNVGMLGESFKYVAPVAGALGFSAQDTAHALGLMANAGIKSSQAGTALRGAITRMMKPSKDAATVIDELGLKLTDAEGNMLPFRDVMDQLRSTFANLTAEQQAQYAATIFGQEAMSGMLAIINASEADYNKLASAIDNSAGAAQKMADEMQDNLKGRLTELKSAIEGVALQLYDHLQPALEKIVGVVQKLVDWFADLSPETQKVIVVIAGLAAAIGPLLIVLGAMASGLSAIIGILPVLGTAFTVLTGPVGLIVAAIAAAIAIGVLLWKNWETISEKAIEIWEAIRDFFVRTFEAIKETITSVWNSIKTFFSDTWESISTTIVEAWEMVKTFFSDTWNNIKETIETIWNSIKDFFSETWDSIQEIFRTVLGWIEDNIFSKFTAVYETISNIWDSVKTTTAEKWNAVWDTLRNIINGITGMINKFIRFWNKIKLRVPSVNIPLVGTVGGFTVGVPNISEIPMLAQGGIITQQTLAMLAEGNRPEAVIPLDKMPGLIADALRDAMGGGQVAMAGGITVQNMYVRNDQDIKLVARELYNLQQQNARGRGLR